MIFLHGKKEKEKQGLSHEGPWEKHSQPRCQKPPLGSGDYERSCSKQPFSGCLKAEVNLPVYLPFERPAAILTRATLNLTWFTDLLPYRGIYIPSILHLQGWKALTHHFGTQITNHPSWLSSLDPSRSLFLSGLTSCEMLAATDYNVQAMARRC